MDGVLVAFFVVLPGVVGVLTSTAVEAAMVEIGILGVAVTVGFIGAAGAIFVFGVTDLIADVVMELPPNKSNSCSSINDTIHSSFFF